ncbi:MAG: ribonuclease P protein component [Clostridia bacterium]|jgi:ribonuclease P protein component|nr:ribonuclease P protein component [Clostridia bacterium]
MLNKRYRLTKRGSFSYVYGKGERNNLGALRITYVRGKGCPKVGISVPNTVGKAVVRNKVRRRIRAALRPMMSGMRSAQIVVSARKGADELTYAQIENMLAELFAKSGLYEKKADALAHN